jgi:hypothetical protein
MHYYRPLSRRVPLKIPICISLVFVRVCYAIACSWDFSITPLSIHTSPAYVYALGYLPSLLVMVTMIAGGYHQMNEDLQIKKLRAEREARVNTEIETGRREAEAQKGGG